MINNPAHTTDKHSQVEPGLPAGAHRFIVLSATGIAAALLGGGLAFEFGKGLRPQDAREIDGLGQIEAIRLPAEARRLADLTSFVINLPGADDYGKVYFNNYLVLSTENPTSLFYNINNPDAAKKVAIDYGAKRNLITTSADVASRIVSQWNYIVVENENSALGGCVTSVDITVNGQRLERFPRSFPKNAYAELTTLNSVLARKFDQAQVGAIIDALCARHIFAFYVDK
jgi:hypothetical protein